MCPSLPNLCYECGDLQRMKGICDIVNNFQASKSSPVIPTVGSHSGVVIEGKVDDYLINFLQIPKKIKQIDAPNNQYTITEHYGNTVHAN